MAKKKNESSDVSRLDKYLPWILAVGGAIALFASTVLTVEKFHKLQNPTTQAVCDLNPILSCTSVASSDQAAAFGIPNPLLGIAGYAAITALAVGVLAGAKYKKWLWRLLNIGLLLALIFLHWLIFQTLYRIGALCIYCMVVWAVTAPMFWYTLLHSLRKNYLPTPKNLQKVVNFANRHHGDILLAWFLIIIFLIGKRFWYYWSTLF